jgi:hypothetical protein
MEPITITIVVLVLASLGTGFGAGWGLKPDGAAKAIEAQTESIKAVQDGQVKITEMVNRPIVIDAELKAGLSKIPVQCMSEMGGDPTSVQCQWATCLQFGQSPAQRPECRAIEELMISSMKDAKCEEIKKEEIKKP